MKKYVLLFILPFALTACKEEGCTDLAAVNYNPDADEHCCCEYANPEPNLRLQIKVLNKDGSALTINQNTQDQFGRLIRFEKFEFYLSNLEAVHSVGSHVSPDVYLVKYDQDYNIDLEVDETNYLELKFNIGLDSVTNLSDPNSFPNNHALSSAQQTYWSWQQMYRFALLEGRLDTNNDQNMDLLFSYHTGENKALRSIVKDYSFEVYPDSLTVVPIEIYWEDIFLDGQQPIDIAQMKSSHMASAAEDSLGMILMDNFKHAIQ